MYVHIPFCRRKCGYCDFYSLPVSGTDTGLMTQYVSALLCHAAAWRQICGTLSADTLYIGGGTPSLLPPAELSRLVDGLRETFNLPGCAEVSVEANPDSLGDDVLCAARQCGVNRLSIGVQSFDGRLLRTLGRPHTAADARAAIQRARRAGFTNISLDLMFGLPGQTRESLQRSLDEALSFSPEHLSCYLLKLEPGTPLYERQSALALPGEDEQTAQYELLCERLGNAGYEHYEISNFARGGMRSRHNLKYWRGADYLGLGAGAHSLMCGRRFAYPRDVGAYTALAHAGMTLPVGAEERTPHDIAEELIMTGLRTSDGICVREPAFAALPNGPDALLRCAKRLSDAGLVRVSGGGHISLTERGMWLSNAVIVELLTAAGL